MASSPSPSSSLPFELVEEILCRTPAGSLERFKRTCKEWCGLISNKRFMHKHVDLSKEQFIRLGHHSFQILDPVTQSLISRLAPNDFLGTYQISTMIHCDGLLLCKTSNSKLAIWNPCLSGVQWIKPSSSRNYDVDQVCGFGYDDASRENYKILRFYVTCVKVCEFEVEIYDVKSHRWTSVETNFKFDWCFDINPRDVSVSMKGNMYWIAQRMTSNKNSEYFILNFDFSTETFKPVCGYVPVETNFCGFVNCTVYLSGFRGDRLSLLSQRQHKDVEVWVTNKVSDEVVSSSKYFTVVDLSLPVLSSCYHRTIPTFLVHKTGHVMLWCEVIDSEGKYVNVYELSQGEIRKQVETGRHKRWDSLPNRCYLFTPSLVPVPE